MLAISLYFDFNEKNLFAARQCGQIWKAIVITFVAQATNLFVYFEIFWKFKIINYPDFARAAI